MEKRANNIDAMLEKYIVDNILDDSIEDYYIEFDSLERPINYPILGMAGLSEWKSIAILAPIIHYSIPNESDVNNSCFYIDVNDKRREWFNIEDVVEVLENISPHFQQLIYCHRFTFNVKLNGFKFANDYIA